MNEIDLNKNPEKANFSRLVFTAILVVLFIAALSCTAGLCGTCIFE